MSKSKGKTIKLSEKAYNAEINKAYTSGYNDGTREVKINLITEFCQTVKCNVCPLKVDIWSTSTPFAKCPIIDQSSNEELDKMIELIIEHLKNRR